MKSASVVESCIFYREPILKKDGRIVCDSAVPTVRGVRCARTPANAMQGCVFARRSIVGLPTREEQKILHKPAT